MVTNSKSYLNNFAPLNFFWEIHAINPRLTIQTVSSPVKKSQIFKGIKVKEKHKRRSILVFYQLQV